MKQGNTLEKRIYKTIAYFDILDMPVTTVQIWRYLVVDNGNTKPYSLRSVTDCLHSSNWLRNKISSKWGYYALQGRIHLIPARLHRHILAAQKWKLAKRIVMVLMYVPFIKMIAGSGSLVLNNTKETSDLDLLIVARSKRIWTARLFLLFATQLTGRRRKYWDQEAPDKVCLNHYVSRDHLELHVNRNIYTALLYAYVIPLYGQSVYQEFMKENQSWMRQFVQFKEHPNLQSRHSIRGNSVIQFFSHLLENILSEPMFDFMETWSERIQRRAIKKHAGETESGRVVVSDQELAFHPGSKEEEIVKQFRLIS